MEWMVLRCGRQRRQQEEVQHVPQHDRQQRL